EVFRRAMKFLCADDEVNVGQPVDQFLSAALRHATEKTEHDVGTVPSCFRGNVLHFSQRLLFSEVAHAASVEQDHIGGGLGQREGVAARDELSRDGFAVALVHLATISLDVNAGHCGESSEGGYLRYEF